MQPEIIITVKRDALSMDRRYLVTIEDDYNGMVDTIDNVPVANVASFTAVAEITGNTLDWTDDDGVRVTLLPDHHPFDDGYAVASLLYETLADEGDDLSL